MTSAAVGIEVIRTDGWLWAAAPAHAYGLIGFVVLDLLLAGINYRGATKLATIGSSLFGGTQFAAMAGDLLMGQPAGVPTGVWESYLLGDASFLALLCIQVFIVVWSLLSARITAIQMGEDKSPRKNHLKVR